MCGRRRGVTLLETVVALTILGIAASAAYLVRGRRATTGAPAAVNVCHAQAIETRAVRVAVEDGAFVVCYPDGQIHGRDQDALAGPSPR